jgi:hypothetical protein
MLEMKVKTLLSADPDFPDEPPISNSRRSNVRRPGVVGLQRSHPIPRLFA